MFILLDPVKKNSTQIHELINSHNFRFQEETVKTDLTTHTNKQPN